MELFFGCVRGWNGRNNNPTVTQFRHTYKALLVNNNLRPGKSGNVTVQDTTQILPVTSSIHNDAESNTQEIIDMIPHFNPLNVSPHGTLSEFSKCVVLYIGCNVVRSIMGKISCPECRYALMSMPGKAPVSSELKLIRRRDNGGLLYPASSVSKILEITESIIRSQISENDNKPLRGVKLMQ